jgi:hypothetical protein
MSLIQEQPEASDVAFNTFIGVLVSVCGNVGILNTKLKYSKTYFLLRCRHLYQWL